MGELGLLHTRCSASRISAENRLHARARSAVLPPPAFPMMHSANGLSEQGDNAQPGRTPFPIWNQAVVPCPVLTVAS